MSGAGVHGQKRGVGYVAAAETERPQNLRCQKPDDVSMELLEPKNSFRTWHRLLIHSDTEQALF